MKRLLRDTFEDAQPSGQLHSTTTADGSVRHIHDVEGVISSDNNALRIRPLVQPGWGRAGIVYGPFSAQSGLLFSALLLNGHNTSQTGALGERFLKRVYRWLLGPNARRTALLRRAFLWLRAGDKRATWQRLRWWWYLQQEPAAALDDNLALGWFTEQSPAHPNHGAAAMIMRGTGAENGELCALIDSVSVPVLRGVPNIPIQYAVLLRGDTVAYYAAALPCTTGLAAFPYFRPLGISAFSPPDALYPGVHQSVLGQIGFRADTRIQQIDVMQHPDLSLWYGTAAAADHLNGADSLDATPAEVSGVWTVISGQLRRTSSGTIAAGDNSTALLYLDEPAGLLRLCFTVTDSAPVDIALLWRVDYDGQSWRVRIADDKATLQLITQERITTYEQARCALRPTGEPNWLQLLDDGNEIRLICNGQILFVTYDTTLQQATGTGFYLARANPALLTHDFEAHPRRIALPLKTEYPVATVPRMGEIVIADYFEGSPAELAQRRTSIGKAIWRRQLGSGHFDVDGSGQLRVRASTVAPNPDRTAYTVPWTRPQHAELEATIIPPGTAHGQQQAGRAGFIFMQDAQRYIIISTWLDDSYDGSSISSFYHLTAFEELYDAVWTNVGRRVTWGQPYRLRVAFDGMQFVAYVDDSPVLYRALTDIDPTAQPLKINAVGIVANWEWGNDTGSVFRDFIARSAS